jgi:ABC-type amino acid transport substrate-binding protein
MLLGTTWATDLFPNRKHMAASNLDSVVKMVAYHRLDAFIESEIVANCKIDTGAYPAELAFTPIAELSPAIYCFGLRRDYPDRGPLLAKIAVAVAELHASGELEDLRYRFSLPRRRAN